MGQLGEDRSGSENEHNAHPCLLRLLLRVELHSHSFRHAVSKEVEKQAWVEYEVAGCKENLLCILMFS
jgi:hypothetical protein